MTDQPDDKILKSIVEKFLMPAVADEAIPAGSSMIVYVDGEGHSRARLSRYPDDYERINSERPGPVVNPS